MDTKLEIFIILSLSKTKLFFTKYISCVCVANVHI